MTIYPDDIHLVLLELYESRPYLLNICHDADFVKFEPRISVRNMRILGSP